MNNFPGGKNKRRRQTPVQVCLKSVYEGQPATHLNMYSMYLVSMKGSLMDTTFTMGFLSEARSTRRPMRPKPLMPTDTGPTD